MPKTEELPRALYRAAQVRELDRIAIEEFGIPGERLMEHAGAAAFALLRERWPAARDVTVVVGTGNNGGDGFVVARLALQAGLAVRVLQLGDRDRLRGDAALNARRFAELGGDWQAFGGLPQHTNVIVDGIFGTGLERAVSGDWAAAVDAINGHAAPVLALDIPSGLHADSGAILGTAVRAAATISFIGLKQGLFTGDGPACCGEVRFDALEVPARLYASQILAARRLDWPGVSARLGARPRTAHKGHYGHVLVLGGDQGMGGAARLAAEAAIRVGAGLVSLGTRPQHVAPALAARPEIMVHGLDDPAGLDPLLERATVIAVGPGLGHDAWGRALWQRARAAPQPLVVDADALRLLGEQPLQRQDWVLTPHPGEAAHLLGGSAAEVQADRFAAAQRLVRGFGGVLVLKGAGTLIASGGARPPAVCTAGNPGMASGGMGDVLTGVIAGLLAQGEDVVGAAELGVCLHAAAADAAAAADGERGLLAGDLMPWLRRLANP
jgi:NAD(P)H-hydrate epimerase